jgi:hypothetical protein
MYGLPDSALSEQAFEQVVTMILRCQRHGNQDRPRTLLRSFLESARSAYLAKECYIDQVSGALEPYTSAVAAVEIIMDTREDIEFIFAAFARHTSFKPCDLDIDPEAKTWEEWKQHISACILHQELLRRYPELKNEDEIRNKKYDHV